MTKVIFPPNPPEIFIQTPDLVDIFLAGSIEMGNAVDWQTRVGQELSEMPEVGCVFNPRRDDFDASQTQSITNEYFSEQVNWELDHIEKAAIIFVNFDPNTKSPITLAELGYIIGRNKPIQPGFPIQLNQSLVVCCPDGYWRQGNVEIMCDRAGLKIFRDFEEALSMLKQEVMAWHFMLTSI